MGFLSSVHEDTIPLHPKDDPVVLAKRREVEAARTALNEIEQRARQLERDRQPADELQALLDTQELAGLRTRYIEARVALSQAQRSFDEAFQRARGPWQEHWQEKYREAAERFLTWLETDALPANAAMLAAQGAAEEAGLRVEPLHIAQLLPEAIAHRLQWRDKLG